jgi:two-component system, NarL family, nitrate/nitrite response regulator NarL
VPGNGRPPATPQTTPAGSGLQPVPLGAGNLLAGAARRDLTLREREVLQLAADGRSTPQIAELLFLSPGTVKTHLHNIYGKLAARDRASAVAQGIRRGLIE